jgi:tetratricopeptide (TPR) repeat protein
MRLHPVLIAVSLAGAALAAPSGSLAMGSAFGGPTGGPITIIQRSKYDPQTEYQAGMAALADQKYRDAKSHFEHVLSVSPTHAHALYEVGFAEANLGDMRAAARDYASALRSDPNLIDALHQLALTEARLGREEQARTDLAKLKHFEMTCASACAQASDITAAIAEVETTLAAPSPSKSPAG